MVAVESGPERNNGVSLSPYGLGLRALPFFFMRDEGGCLLAKLGSEKEAQSWLVCGF